MRQAPPVLGRSSSTVPTDHGTSGGTGAGTEHAPGHHGIPKAQARRLGEATMSPGDRTHLMPASPTSRRAQVPPHRAIRDCGRDRERDRQVAGRLGEADPADGREVDVLLADRRAGARARTARIMSTRPRSSLEVARRGWAGRRRRRGPGPPRPSAAALEVTVTQVPGTRRSGRRREEHWGRRGRDDADIGEVEAADLVGRAEAVLTARTSRSRPCRSPSNLHDHVDEGRTRGPA